MTDGEVAARLARLPATEIFGRSVPVAVTRLSRLAGLAHLDRGRAGAGILIPRCSCVHTFGMRFDLDLLFLDARGLRLAEHREVPRRRVVWHRGASLVLELPSRGKGGESSPWSA